MWQQSARDDYSVYILVVFRGFVMVGGVRWGERGKYGSRVHGLKSSACFVYPIIRAPRPRRDTRCRCRLRWTLPCCHIVGRVFISCTWLLVTVLKIYFIFWSLGSWPVWFIVAYWWLKRELFQNLSCINNSGQTIFIFWGHVLPIDQIIYLCGCKNIITWILTKHLSIIKMYFMLRWFLIYKKK